MTEEEKREIYHRCYLCGGLGSSSFWNTIDESDDYRVGFCERCAAEWGDSSFYDLPLLPIPYLEMFDDERPINLHK